MHARTAVLRKAFLDEHGYLDEAFAPLYGDDMDICFRAASVGGKVYCILMDVENDSLSQRITTPRRRRWFAEIMRRNTDLFYSRWRPSTEKDYLWLHRTPSRTDRGGGQGIARVLAACPAPLPRCEKAMASRWDGGPGVRRASPQAASLSASRLPLPVLQIHG